MLIVNKTKEKEKYCKARKFFFFYSVDDSGWGERIHARETVQMMAAPDIQPHGLSTSPEVIAGTPTSIKYFYFSPVNLNLENLLWNFIKLFIQLNICLFIYFLNKM